MSKTNIIPSIHQAAVKAIVETAEVELQKILFFPVTVRFRLLNRPINHRLIKRLVLDQFGIRNQDFVSSSRKTSLVTARQIFSYLCSTYAFMSHEDIGDCINRDRSTVSTGLVTIYDLIDAKDEYTMANLTPLKNKLDTLINEKNPTETEPCNDERAD